MRWQTVLKILFSLIILGVLFHEVRFKTLLPYFHQMIFSQLVIACLLPFTANLLGATRWLLIMRSLDAPWRPKVYFKTFFKGFMFNQVLPSSVGGDGYRMIETAKLDVSKQLAITSVIVDRVIGFSGLVSIAACALPLAYHRLPHPLFHFVLLIVLGCIGSVITLASIHYLRHPIAERWGRWLYNLSETLHNSIENWHDALFKLALAVGTNLANTLSFYFISNALGIQVSAIDFLIIVPYVSLMMMIPLSMAGWGIREGAMVMLGHAVGLPQGAALAISLINGLTMIINALPGLYLYCTHHHPHTTQQPSSKPT